ncbi:MAG TPA: sigma-70 family RNA polymerase sigma factor [Verrucomicrobiae bacterium]|nr:sigma-70 family RNA polymerase sigma factor [Verrucomicrobiae bacterium]
MTSSPMTSNAESPVRNDDESLVRRLKARDRNALEDLLRLHGAKLYGVALQFMRNENEAREVMQDALVSVWNKIGSFEGKSAFTSWLYRVTANAALMSLRKKKRRENDISLDAPVNDEDDIPLPALRLRDKGPSPDNVALTDELGDQVRAAIDQLPEPYRVVVLLRDVEELPMTEVMEATGLSEPALKSRLHRARLALREALLPYLKGEDKQTS